MERAFKGIWIPREIWLNKELTLLEKVFFVEIDSLDNEEGCFAGNEYFQEFFELSKSRCSEIINSLKKKGFIEIKYIYKPGTKHIEKRIMKVVGIPSESRRPPSESRSTPSESRSTPSESRRPPSENTKDNNTINNTINNTFINTTTRDVVVDKIKSYFDFSEKEIDEAIKAFYEKNEKLDYLVAKLELTKNNPNTRNVIGYLISAIKNDYKPSIAQPKCFIPKVNTRYHNINQTFMNYEPDELEKMLLENQKNKFI